MTLDEDECWTRLDDAGHGVLATLHPVRGVDAVPVVFVVVGGLIGTPIDTVKAKRHMRLARIDNLTRDARCVLLVDRYSDDWSQLWWVRVHARAEPDRDPTSWAEALTRRYPAYGQPGAIAGVLSLRPTAVTGWAAH